MILAIDIGNTTLSLGVVKNGKILQAASVVNSLSSKKFASRLKALLKGITIKYSDIRAVVICSVVPSQLEILKKVIKKQLKLKPIIIGKDIKVPMVNNYNPPGHVGQDRLVGAYAAARLYGRPCVVIDFGTANTFDVVNHKGEYEGGMIVPGIRLSAEALFQKTALLPRIDMVKSPKNLIGKTTHESILSGLFHGYGAMSSGLIDLIAQNIKGKPKVIVTGGYTDLMRRFIYKKIDKIDPYLVFRGIDLIYRQSQ